jgi:hypothetical protein
MYNIILSFSLNLTYLKMLYHNDNIPLIGLNTKHAVLCTMNPK